MSLKIFLNSLLHLDACGTTTGEPSTFPQDFSLGLQCPPKKSMAVSVIILCFLNLHLIYQ